MSPLRSSRSAFLAMAAFAAASCFAASCLAVGCFAQGQTYPSIQEVRVSGLPALMARTHDPSDVLLTSLDTIIRDRNVCCGKDSALEDDAAAADPSYLNDVARKVQGRHLLSDGRAIMITAEYFEPAAINSGMLLATLRDKHALLFEWNSRLYVCYGVTYQKDYDSESGAERDTIHKFLLLDTRYSGSRRKVVFNRGSDDWSDVQGMLRVAVSQP